MFFDLLMVYHCLPLSLFLASVAVAAQPLPSFRFSVDWKSGTDATTLPTGTTRGGGGFGVRKIEYINVPAASTWYAYADIVNYSDPYYPDSYSSEIGVFRRM